MSFCNFSDLFGRFRKRKKTRFTDLETTAKELLEKLWLNSLLGLHFVDWLKYQRVEQYFQEHPEELVGESAATFERLKQRKYTDKFRAVCANVLSELDK